MVKEAILALKEKSGSSPVAIHKFLAAKYKEVPTNFKKILGLQLKKFSASGKLVKVKASFKLGDSIKPKPERKPKVAAAKTQDHKGCCESKEACKGRKSQH